MILKTKFKAPDEMTANDAHGRLLAVGFGPDVALLLVKAGFKLCDCFLEIEERGNSKETI